MHNMSNIHITVSQGMNYLAINNSC